MGRRRVSLSQVKRVRVKRVGMTDCTRLTADCQRFGILKYLRIHELLKLLV